jgi:hypothetical protein
MGFDSLTVFDRLCGLLKQYAAPIEVNADSSTEYGLKTHWRRPKDE